MKRKDRRKRALTVLRALEKLAETMPSQQRMFGDLGGDPVTASYLSVMTSMPLYEIQEALESPKCPFEPAPMSVEGERVYRVKDNMWWTGEKPRQTHATRQKSGPIKRGPAKVPKAGARYGPGSVCERCGSPIVGGRHAKSKRGHPRGKCDVALVENIMKE